MIEEQNMSSTSSDQLCKAVSAYATEGYRLVHVTCAKIGTTFELTWAFDREYHYEGLRLVLPDSTVPVPSISHIFWTAFLYENEIHDLFGLTFSGMNVDYKGNFYRTGMTAPFAQSSVPASPIGKPAVSAEKSAPPPGAGSLPQPLIEAQNQVKMVLNTVQSTLSTVNDALKDTLNSLPGSKPATASGSGSGSGQKPGAEK